MTRADNTVHLRQAATDRHETAVARARATLEEFDRSGRLFTFPAVARAAGVSRSWLYKQPDLRCTIIRLRSSAATEPTVPAAQRATPDSIHSRLNAAREEISRLRTENTVLHDQLARSIGDQRARR